jgi:hypothetical protein
MTAVPVTSRTVAIASDVGVDAAAEFDHFLTSLTSRGLVEAAEQRIWMALESSGWLAAGEVSGGEGLHLLDLVELAIVWGRHLIPAPFLTTVTARRHLGTDVAPSAGGYTYALVSAPRAYVPFGGLAGCAFLARLMPGDAEVGHLTTGAVDDFALSLPLVTSVDGSVVAPEILHETLVLLAAEAIGMAEALLEQTIAYANVRKAYGQEIGRFQAIRFRLADVHCDIETMHGLVVAAVNEPQLARRAARLVVRTSRKIAETCLQTHGAIGFTWDLGLHRYLRHAMTAERLLAQHADHTEPGVLRRRQTVVARESRSA